MDEKMFEGDRERMSDETVGDAVQNEPQNNTQDTPQAEPQNDVQNEPQAEPQNGAPSDTPRETEPAGADAYTVQNPNPYFNYYQNPAPQATVTPVAVKKNKNPLAVALIVVSVLLVLSLLGSMLTIFYMRRGGFSDNNDTQTNNGSGTVLGSDDDSTGNVTVTQKTKGDGNEMTVQQVAKKVINQVVGIVVNTGEGFYASEGQGSGIIFSEDGYIITNAHVVDGATSVKVVLPDEKNTTYDAKIVGSDTKTDLAVLKVDATGLEAATIGNSDELEVGETVVAIGNPYGLEFQSSVTAGIISAVNRAVTLENTKMNLLQTDAAINPGNSGGALVNLYGQVVGINSSKISSTEAEGLGFSIPINDAIPIVQELISKGYISGRPMIGIQGQDVNQQMSAMYRIPTGVYVYYIDESSNAYKAGLRQYDIITKFNGQDITCFADLDSAKDKCKAGDEVEITYYRYKDGKYYDAKIVLSESTKN